MADFLVPHHAWVLVGDGRKALLLLNEGRPDTLDLRVQHVLKSDNPASQEQGTDRPGRSFSSGGTARSAYAETDWHELEEHRFAGHIAQALTGLSVEKKLTALVLIAPAKVLGELRAALPPAVRSLVIGELSKDLTRHSVEAIEKILLD